MVPVILCLLIMIPIIAGWLILFVWPFLIAGLAAFGLVQNKIIVVLSRRLLFQDGKEREIFHLLQVQKFVPWKRIDSALEISCRTKLVSDWMKKLGVRTADGLCNKSNLRASFSYPDCYDLVTSLIDRKIHQKLNEVYRQAAGYLRTGGTFISIETYLDHHLFSQHIRAAQKYGLSLVDRSDRPHDLQTLPSREIWLRQGLRPACIMMVWSKQ